MELAKIQNVLLTIFVLTVFNALSDGPLGVDASSRKWLYQNPEQYNQYGITKLFVFGDSYVDTGNLHEMFRREPYGHAWKKPSGRYSDGFVLTDHVARFLRMLTPEPYHWRKPLKSRLHYGMNFAYGGAGVIESLLPRPNISTQIDYFEKLIQDSVYTKYDLEESLVLVAISGNDYDAYLENGGGVLDLVLHFTTTVITELGEDLKRIAKLGAKRIAVTTLPPIGCLPYITQPSGYKECNATGNLLPSIHNSKLNVSVSALNDEILGTSFALVDIVTPFTTILNNKGDSTGTLKFPTPLKPCCSGIDDDHNCGDVGSNGGKLYTVCENPESAFFWDGVHPTQAGWRAVFKELEPAFEQICTFS